MHQVYNIDLLRFTWRCYTSLFINILATTSRVWGGLWNSSLPSVTHTDKEKNLKGRTIERFALEGTFKVIQSNPLQSAGTTSARPGCSEPSPPWPWQFPWMGEPPTLWLRVFQLPHFKKVILYVQSQSILFKTITTCPVIRDSTKKVSPYLSYMPSLCSRRC